MDDTTIRAICDLFDLGAPRETPTAVVGGLTNRLWRLQTARGRFALKEMNRDPDRVDYVAWFDRAFTLEQAAYEAGIPMPRPVPTVKSGRCLAELPGPDGAPMTVRVHHWIDGEKLDNGVAYPAEDVARAAVLLADIHRLGIAPNVTPADALRTWGADYWAAAAGRAHDAGLEWADELVRLLPVIAELEGYVEAAYHDPTPLLLSHRDSDMKNVVRTPAGAMMLVDWDAAGPVNPRHDVANNALVWAGLHRGDPDPALARSFIDAYRRGSGAGEAFRPTDLAELVAARLGWFDFNVRRALGERTRDDADRRAGVGVFHRNAEQLPRFARSLDAWLAVLGAPPA